MIRVGLIGLGRVANLHREAVLADGRARVVAVCDADADRAASRAGEWDAIAVADPSGFAGQAAVDALVVMVPPGATLAVMRAAAPLARAVLLEKPIATDPADGAAVIDVCRVAGTTLLVGHNGLFHPGFEALKAALDAGRIGQVTSASAESAGWLAFRPDDFRTRAQAAGGGVWADTGSHLVYSLQALLGEVVEARGIFAHGARPEMEGEDTALVHLRFASGAVASVEASYGRKRPGWQADWPEGYHLELTLWGTEGALRYRLCPEAAVEIADDAGWQPLAPIVPFAESFRCQASHFLDLAEGGGAPRTTGQEALAVLRVLRAAYATRPMEASHA